MIATRRAALAALALAGPGHAAILPPDLGRGHYELCRAADLARFPLYELVGISN